MRSRSRSELRDDVIRHAVYPAGLLRAIEGQRRTESAGEGAKLMSYIPPEEQRLKIPTVTRGQVMVNTLVSWAELSHTMTGRGFVANRQAAGEDGSWLRLSARNAANQGKSNKSYRKKRKGKSKMETTQDDSLAALFARNAQVYLKDDSAPGL